MKATVLALALAMAIPLAFVRAASEDDKFQQLASAYIEEELAAHPEQATELGDHRFDAVRTDYSDETRDRILAVAMLAIPQVIDQARTNLQHPPRVHTETAIEQVQGAIGLVREGLSPLLERAPPMKKELVPLQEKTARALEDYKKWLQDDLL